MKSGVTNEAGQYRPTTNFQLPNSGFQRNIGSWDLEVGS
jgi:hypothetical protein